MEKVILHWKKKEQEKLISQGYSVCNKTGRKLLCLNCKC